MTNEDDELVGEHAHLQFRRLIAGLDGKAGALLALVEEELAGDPNLPDLDDLVDCLEHLQELVSELQEEAGWI